MTRADELRRMLDERGVKWWSHGEQTRTWYKQFCVSDRITHMHIDGVVETPEQAIAATLGSGTLTAKQVSKATYAHSIHADCVDADWQAIADELNATLGIGKCEMEPVPFMGWKCSKCEKVSMIFGDKGREMPSFCPNCGAKVINR